MLFRRKNKQEEQNSMAKIDDIIRDLSADERKELRDRLSNGDDTTQEIKEARRDIEEKGSDSQTERDRIDESVAARERESGTQDSQSAKDRVDEAIGEDRALDKKREEAYDARADVAALREEIANLSKMVAAVNSNPVEVKEDKRKSSLDEAARLYLN